PIHTNSLVFMYTHLHAPTHPHTFMNTHRHTHCTCTSHMHTCRQSPSPLHTHTHKHTHRHTHTHTLALFRLVGLPLLYQYLCAVYFTHTKARSLYHRWPLNFLSQSEIGRASWRERVL